MIRYQAVSGNALSKFSYFRMAALNPPLYWQQKPTLAPGDSGKINGTKTMD